MNSFIRSIEEIALNAFPAESTDLYDGWVIRRTPHYPSRRINSVNIMTEPDSQTLMNKIHYCETFLRKFQNEVAFKMTSMKMHQAMDQLLESRGYDVITPTDVMTLALKGFAHIEPDLSLNDFTIKMESTLTHRWLMDYIAFKALDEGAYKTLWGCLEKISNPVHYLSIYHDDKWIGAGQAVIEDDHVGLFDIAVHEDYRRKGIGRLIVERLIEKAKNEGAEFAYLQVVADNEPAKNLYNNIGFKKAYQYWYRTQYASIES